MGKRGMTMHQNNFSRYVLEHMGELVITFDDRGLISYGNKIAEESLKQSDFVLTVPTDRAGLFDIEKLDKCYKFGYDTVMQNIDKIK